MEFDTIADPFRQYFDDACRRKTDINEHLPTLYALAKTCNSVIEFGTRLGESSRAFLYATTRKIGPSFRSYDLVIEPMMTWLFQEARNEGAEVQLIQGNTLEIDIPFVDMLFIDTWHEYEHLTKELERHHNKINKYIVCHDTKSYPNILDAIIHFLILHPEWEFHNHYTHNNGLTILRRKKIVV